LSARRWRGGGIWRGCRVRLGVKVELPTVARAELRCDRQLTEPSVVVAAWVAGVIVTASPELLARTSPFNGSPVL
jgi:hypothetical protein